MHSYQAACGSRNISIHCVTRLVNQLASFQTISSAIVKKLIFFPFIGTCVNETIKIEIDQLVKKVQKQGKHFHKEQLFSIFYTFCQVQSNWITTF